MVCFFFEKVKKEHHIRYILNTNLYILYGSNKKYLVKLLLWKVCVVLITNHSGPHTFVIIKSDGKSIRGDIRIKNTCYGPGLQVRRKCFILCNTGELNII